MRNLLLFIILLPHLLQAQSFFGSVNQFLIDHVDEGKVDYANLKNNPETLNQLAISISEFFLSNQSEDYFTAFYINAYNIMVIKQVVDNYPINSPKDVPGFFDQTVFTIAGERLTLDQIEFEKLIGLTGDPRIHFALGCAASSCPFLYDQAYTPDQLQQQLDFRAQLIIDRPNYVEVDKSRRVVRVNKIFDWYGDQFKTQNLSILEYINQFRFYDVPTDYSIEYLEYDWTLNSK